MQMTISNERRKELSSFKHMIIITIPIFIELLLQLVVGYSDQLMMSNWQNVVNGITNANVVINMILNFFVVFAAASIILITQYKGAGDKKRENNTYSTAFYFNTIMSFIMTLFIVFFSRFYLKALNTPESALNDAILYSMIAGASVVFQVMATTISSFLIKASFNDCLSISNDDGIASSLRYLISSSNKSLRIILCSSLISNIIFYSSFL